MAGHSKWANIKHKKAATDAKRGKIFTRLIRRSPSPRSMGGADPSMNPRLRLAIDKATANNMPKDTIERAAKRGAGELEGVAYEEIRYEGYGINGAAVIVDCMTDNRTRTVADVRHAFSKYGGNLGTDGSVAFLFKHCGQLVFAPGTDEDKLMEAALDAGADDVVANDDGSLEVITGPYDFVAVKDALVKAGFKPEFAEVTMKPSDRGRDDRRGRREDAEAPRRDRIARRRAERLHQRRHRRVALRCPRPAPPRNPNAASSASIPGLRMTGFGVIACHRQPSSSASRAAASAAARASCPSASASSCSDLGEVIARHRPTEVAVEKVFVNVNPQSTLLLGQARGAAISAAVLAHLPVAEYTALQVKQAVVGHGKAAKEQVQEMVRRLLDLRGTPSPDAADALACAIAHAHGAQGLGWRAHGGFPHAARGRLV